MRLRAARSSTSRACTRNFGLSPSKDMPLLAALLLLLLLVQRRHIAFQGCSEGASLPPFGRLGNCTVTSSSRRLTTRARNSATGGEGVV